MVTLVFDTETEGVPRFVQLGALLCNDAGAEVSSINVLVKPEGWKIDERMVGDDGKPTGFSVHGITNERATQYGIPEVAVVALYAGLCHAAALHVSYAGAFDRKIMRIAALRAGMKREEIEQFEAPPQYCPMKVATPIINLPATEKMVAAGFGHKPKPPKLIECIKHFFGEELAGAHDALADARACYRVYRHLLTLEAKSA